ncbi:hypothetical protein [Nonomuraea antri]|uniref:hypothetical protein n=1 Tax=Nonomuraea antri TaxID=2730852 RepID=UPI001F3623F2|nr:hypothetical protein [Nonomuraea antri]
MRGAAAECRRLLAQAHACLDDLDERDELEAPWLAGVGGRVHVESGAAAALRDIAVRTAGVPPARLATAAAERALDLLPAQQRPARLLFTLRLADGHACAGEPEAALAIAGPALSEVADIQDSLIRQELNGLRNRLTAKWSHHQGVRDFTDRLRSPAR